MAAQNHDLPFQRGSTAFSGVTTIGSTDLAHLEGMEFVVPDTQYATGEDVRLRIVRNTTGAAITGGGRLVTFANFRLRAADGYCDTTLEFTRPVDDAYGTTFSIAANDLFYIVVSGPCLIYTAHSADAANVLTVGDFVQGATAATSGATTAGRMENATFAITGNTAPNLIKQVNAVIGRALTARTTANTNTLTLVRVGLPY